MYVAADEHCAFIESFGHNTRLRRVGYADLRTRYLSRVEASRPLRLVDFTGARIRRLGADARLFAADISIARAWSLAFYRHPTAPDGICYHSRHDPERLCAVFFDKVAPDLTATRLGTLADPRHEALLASILGTYGFGLGAD